MYRDNVFFSLSCFTRFLRKLYSIDSMLKLNPTVIQFGYPVSHSRLYTEFRSKLFYNRCPFMYLIALWYVWSARFSKDVFVILLIGFLPVLGDNLVTKLTTISHAPLINRWIESQRVGLFVVFHMCPKVPTKSNSLFLTLKSTFRITRLFKIAYISPYFLSPVN